MTFIDILIGIAIGFFSGYLTSYFNQKGSNKALLEDNERLTKQIESVKANYQLDLEKRKFKYESKREQYFKYFNTIDDYHIDSGKEMYDQFFTLFSEFNTGIVNADGDKTKENETVNKFSTQLNNLMFRINDDLIRIKNETNTIKLIASDTILELLMKLEKLYDRSFEESTKMLNTMNDIISKGANTEIETIQNNITSIGEEIIKTRNLLTEEVRNELNDI